jgi:hypothetical protein
VISDCAAAFYINRNIFFERITMSTENAVDMETIREAIASDFKQNMSEIMEPAKLDAAVAHLSSPASSFPANGSVVSLVLYLQVQVTITGSGNKQFNGKAAGLSFPGGGVLIGDVYTKDLTRMYRDTVSFQLTATPVYCSVVFFDANNNILGSFQAGAISIVTGIAAGEGRWG